MRDLAPVRLETRNGCYFSPSGGSPPVRRARFLLVRPKVTRAGMAQRQNGHMRFFSRTDAAGSLLTLHRMMDEQFLVGLAESLGLAWGLRLDGRAVGLTVGSWMMWAMQKAVVYTGRTRDSSLGFVGLNFPVHPVHKV